MWEKPVNQLTPAKQQVTGAIQSRWLELVVKLNTE
jgi:hypothetical protein